MPLAPMPTVLYPQNTSSTGPASRATPTPGQETIRPGQDSRAASNPMLAAQYQQQMDQQAFDQFYGTRAAYTGLTVDKLSPEDLQKLRESYAKLRMNQDNVREGRNGIQQAMGAYVGGPYYAVGDQIYTRPGGDPNAGWVGGGAPMAGADQRLWQNISNPLAYQYGGRVGGAEAEENRYAQMAQDAYGRTGPQMNLDQYGQSLGLENQSRGAQNRGLDMLEKSALGQGPSVAQAQLQGGLAQSMRNQLQVAASGRGGGASLVAAGQNAAAQNAQMSSAANFQAAQVRAQEMMNAQNNFSQQATQMRASDLQRAGLDAQTAMQQAQLEAQQRGLNQQAALALEEMRRGVFNSQMGAQQAGEAQNTGVLLSQQQMQAQKDAADNAATRQLIGGAITAVGTVAGGALGGPAGAAAGGAAGGAAANALANQATQPSGGGPSTRYLT